VEPKAFKQVEDYGHMSDGEVITRVGAVVLGMDDNPDFSHPPVAISDLRAGVKTFSALVAEALDRSSKVVAEKNNQREVVIGMMRLLGRYVEITSDGIWPSSYPADLSLPRTQKFNRSFQRVSGALIMAQTREKS